MKILYTSNGTLTDNENLKQGFCKKYKDTKIGSMKCQKCKFFNNNICTNSKNNKHYIKMNHKVIYTNDTISLVHIPLTNGGFSKHFYMVDKNNLNVSCYHTWINGFKTIQELKDSVLFLKSEIEYWGVNSEHGIKLQSYIDIYKTIDFNMLQND